MNFQIRAADDPSGIAGTLREAVNVVALHAHPDDESLATGGTLAMLAARGAHVTLVTATRGERGEVVPGPLKALEGTDRLTALRESELAEAVTALGVERQIFLGAAGARVAGKPPRRYVDSGMIWAAPGIAAAAPDAPQDAFSIVDIEESVADLLAVLRSVRPDLVITYDASGGYGHPDHVRMHEAGRRAANAAGVELLLIEPSAASEQPAAGSEQPAFGAGSALVLPVDIRPWLSHKLDALRAHRSQLTLDGEHYTLSGGQRHPVERIETFRRDNASATMGPIASD